MKYYNIYYKYHKMAHTSIIDIYDLVSFNEYNDYHRLKFVIDKKIKFKLYVNDINYNYKPSKKYSNQKHTKIIFLIIYWNNLINKYIIGI